MMRMGKRVMVILGEHDAMFGGEAFGKELEDVGWAGDVVEMEDVEHLIVRKKLKETAEVLGRCWAKYEDDLEG
jgi:hypothetical protein